MSVAKDAKLRRKANRKLRQLGERPVTKAMQVKCELKAAGVCKRVKMQDDKSLSLAERAAAKAANRRLSDSWDKREPGNVKDWFNPTGKQYVR
ncbi:hypothetical protein D305_gp01 [Pseudomonas phage UFV-P2]|uniref:Uncharacterized protein n=1 Tax=Pseudomonas phage UFV-P2 TaxID=1235661 RepID=K0IGP7_9CAUD|nr:hypothetical protein D305_gp01 [Pseudomonas phage UFV-P2]AFU62957.2 hypothetical protein [Pseudomonas phage UFV-P2]